MKCRTHVLGAVFYWLALNLGSAHELPTTIKSISAELNFANSETINADIFFEKLENNDGKIVRLDLEIIPNQEPGNLGYTLHAVGMESEKDQFICGNGNYGLIDNLTTNFVLSFTHPENFHFPSTINIGDRRTFPFQSVYCGIENYTSLAYTSLKLSGTFVVFVAQIPTANQIVLFPYND
ncbi:MAG: hypothetical protein AB8B94_13395 [Hyphomicrobiales bacterium]